MMNLSLLLLQLVAVTLIVVAATTIRTTTTNSVVVVEAFTATSVTRRPLIYTPVPGAVNVSPTAQYSSHSTKLFSSTKPLGTDGDDDEDVPFALRDTTTATSTSSSSSSEGFDPSEIMSKIQGALPSDLNLNLDLGAFGESLGALQQNLMDGPVGERGEVYAIAQVGVVLCILVGTVPVVGNLLMLLLGPVLLLAGIAVMVLSVQTMGSALSPWPTPPSSGGKLITDGMYAEVRHPMYAGLLAACTGYSIVTDSASRLILTALLLYVLDVKTNKEEDAMRAAYPGEYDTYSQKVTNKFFPQSVLDIMPWNNDE